MHVLLALLGLVQDSIVGTFGEFDLRIDYLAGDGNDVSLYSTVTAVPEPSSLALVGISSIGFYIAKRRRKRRASGKSRVKDLSDNPTTWENVL